MFRQLLSVLRAVAIALLAGGCTSNEHVSLDVPFGSGPDHLGYVHRDIESSGPESFRITSRGEIAVLDTVNSRILVFQNQTIVARLLIADLVASIHSPPIDFLLLPNALVVLSDIGLARQSIVNGRLVSRPISIPIPQNSLPANALFLIDMKIVVISTHPEWANQIGCFNVNSFVREDCGRISSFLRKYRVLDIQEDGAAIVYDHTLELIRLSEDKGKDLGPDQEPGGAEEYQMHGTIRYFGGHLYKANVSKHSLKISVHAVK